jgi:hypothetical protein
MKLKFTALFSLIFVLNSCKNDTEKRQIETEKDIKKKELIFSIIEKAWVFNAKPINETSRSTALAWNDWHAFLTELDQKPKKTIGAFQKKSTEISKKVMVLKDNIPLEFSNPQIKARIAVLTTKVQMLDLYIHLSNIPEQKVIDLIPEINIQLVALQNQMDKIVQKSKIPLEEGESELRMMMDSTRAIPNVEPDLNIPSVE